MSALTPKLTAWDRKVLAAVPVIGMHGPTKSSTLCEIADRVDRGCDSGTVREVELTLRGLTELGLVHQERKFRLRRPVWWRWEWETRAIKETR